MRRASSSPLARMMGATGPNSSSRASGSSFRTSRQIWGGRTRPSGLPPGTSGANAFPQAIQLLSIDDGTDHGVGLSRVSILQLPSPIREALHERLINPLVHDRANHGHADLPLVQEFPEYSGVQGLAQLGIAQNDERRVAAQLEFDALDN